MRADAVSVPAASSAAAVAPASPSHQESALTQRASLNAVQALLDYGGKLLVGFVITPILVSGLGSALYGVWEILSRLIGYMTATDARPTEALRLVVATRQGLNDPAGDRRVVGSALAVWVIFLPLVLAVGAALIWLAPHLAKVETALRPVVQITAALLVASFLVAALAAVPESVLRGMNLGYKRMGLQAGLSVVSGIMMVVAVRQGFGLAGLAASQVALGVLTGACFWLLAARYVPWFGVARPSRPEVRSLLGMSGWLAGGELIAKVSLTSDVLILGAVVSSSVVTTYVLTGYAARLAMGLHVLAVGAAMPGVGGVLGERQFARARQLRRELLLLTWLFSIVIGVTILLWNQSFLALWVGNRGSAEPYAGSWVNLLIVLLTIQTALLRSDSYILDAALKPRARVIMSAIAGVLSLGFGIALAPSLGMVGVCLGLLAGRAVQSIAYPVLVAKSLGEGQGAGWRSLVRPTLVSGILLSVAAAASDRLLVSSWAACAAGVAFSVALLLPVTLAVGLGAGDRRLLLARIQTIGRGLRRNGGTRHG